MQPSGVVAAAAGEELEDIAALLASCEFADPDEEPAPAPGPSSARPRRARQLRREELQPDGTLDLHGLKRDEALSRTRTYLAQAVRLGWSLVVIVTGKGLRSPHGPVLRGAVEECLRQSQRLVVEWHEAPPRLGGSGALAVFLRSRG